MNNCLIHMYVDDTVLYYFVRMKKLCQLALMEDVERADLWFRVNKLSINPPKSKSMLFWLSQKLWYTGNSIYQVYGRYV